MLRTRVFDIVVNGRALRTEPAGDRIALELQHELATERYRGKFVHVRERFVVAEARPTPTNRVGRSLPIYR